jgi:hypothetical protein
LLGANRYEDKSLLQLLDKLVAFLGSPAVPTTRNAQQAGTDQHRLFEAEFLVGK